MILGPGLDSRLPACLKRPMLRLPRLLLPLLVCACARESVQPLSDATVAQVRIEARSRLPDPAKSSYADALYTARVEVLGTAGRAPLGDRRVTLLFPGFARRVPNPEAAFAPGDLVEVDCIPLDQASRQQQAIQQADDLGDVELPVHLALRSRRIEAVNLPPPPTQAPAARTASTLERNEHRVTPAEESARAAAVAADLAELDRLAAARGGWDAWWEATAPQRAELRGKVAAAGGVLARERLSLSDLSILDARFNPADADERRLIDALLQLRDIFAEGGTHFILAPFPDRTLVAAPHFLDASPEDGIVQPEVLRMRRELLAAGIETLDATAATRAEFNGEDFLFFYDSPDPHPAEGAVRALAGVVAKRLARYDLPRPASGLRIQHKPYRGPVPFGGAAERTAKRADMIVDAEGRPLGLDAAGPLLFLGDSFLESPAGYGPVSAGLAYQVARLTAIRPGVFERKSGAFHMLRYAVRQPRIVFPDRKVAVFVTSTANLFLHPGEWALVDRSREKESRRLADGAFPKAAPLRTWTPQNNFAGAVVSPHGSGHITGEGLWIDLGEVPVSVLLPLPGESAGRAFLMGCTLKSSGYADAVVRSGDSEDELPVLKGESRLIVRVVSDGMGACIEFPPGDGGVLLREVDARIP